MMRSDQEEQMPSLVAFACRKRDSSLVALLCAGGKRGERSAGKARERRGAQKEERRGRRGRKKGREKEERGEEGKRPLHHPSTYRLPFLDGRFERWV